MCASTAKLAWRPTVTPIALVAVAEDGSFVDSHKCYCVILEWLLKRKQWPGDVVRAFNTTRMLDRICAKYGRTLIECPIGFKYICDLILAGNVLDRRRRIGRHRHHADTCPSATAC